MKKYFLLLIIAACLFMTNALFTFVAHANDDDEKEEFSPWAAWRKPSKSSKGGGSPDGSTSEARA